MDDVRTTFIRRRDKALRGVHSGDGSALGRLDAVIVEMERVLGPTDPDTLETQLLYVEAQVMEPSFGTQIVRVIRPQLPLIEQAFGSGSSQVIRGRFAALIQDLQGYGDSRWIDDLGDDLNEAEMRELAAESNERLTRMKSELREAARDYAVLRGDESEAGAIADAVTSCFEGLLADDMEAAVSSFDDLRIIAGTRTNYEWILQPVELTLERCANAKDAATISIEEACIEIADVVRSLAENDATWDEFLDEHQAGVALAQLVAMSLAVVTEDGAELIEVTYFDLAQRLSDRE